MEPRILKDFTPSDLPAPQPIETPKATENNQHERPVHPGAGDIRGTSTGTTNPRPFKPHSFALEWRKSGAAIYFGRLRANVSILRFERICVAGQWVNSLTGQDAISKLEAIPPDNLDADHGHLRATELEWWGDVYLYWEQDPTTGEITKCDVRGPDEPEGFDIADLSEELSRGSSGDGKYFLKIGSVDEDGTVDQIEGSDVTWSIALIPEDDSSPSEDSSSEESETSSEETSSEETSSEETSSEETSSEETSSEETSSEETSSQESSEEASEGSTPSGGSESEKSSNAIVEGPWAKGKHVALATVESNQVLFEFIVRDIRLKGPRTLVMIDPRFIFVCEPDSMCVASSPCGDRPYPVGASVKGHVLTLTGLARADRRPKTVNVRLTGIRKGFGAWDMPSRTAKQKAQSEAARRREYDR